MTAQRLAEEQKNEAITERRLAEEQKQFAINA
jgi:hypothetical protein